MIMTNFNSEDLQEYKKEAAEELRQEFKDAIHRQNVIDYISDSLPDILSEAANNIGKDDYYWPEEVARIVAEFLSGKQTQAQKDSAIMEIGHLIFAGIYSHAESMVSMSEDD